MTAAPLLGVSSVEPTDRQDRQMVEVRLQGAAISGTAGDDRAIRIRIRSRNHLPGDREVSSVGACSDRPRGTSERPEQHSGR